MIKDFHYWTQDYVIYLMELLGLKKNFYSNHKDLIVVLQQQPFTYCIDMDANRAKDGKELRKDFYKNKNISCDFFQEKPCSVLEMLVALAIRMDEEYVGVPGYKDPGDLFLQFLRDLNLLNYTDHRFQFSSNSLEDIVDILDIWLGRRFSPNGKGSIFPLRYTKKDQRNLEIWDQMMCYIYENY